MNKLSFLLIQVLFIGALFVSELNLQGGTSPIATPPNEHWIEWDSKEGIQRQESSQFKTNLFKLLRFYESQVRGTYCGVATAVIALNALAIKAPASQYLGKYRLFTQEEFFNGVIGEAISKEVVVKQGISLNDMATLMKTQPLTVTSFAASFYTDEEIRENIITALQNPNELVLTLYQRQELKQDGNGHWSPIAAYDEVSDSFLVLDVARYKYPPSWINASTLITSMREPDEQGLDRGFIILNNQVKE